MSLGTIRIGNLTLSRLILGGNPFSGISHQTPQRDAEMRAYYTTERIKATMRQAERLGINTFLGRTDRHITRILIEYRAGGGALQWIAQTAPELVTIERSIQEALYGGAQAVFLHGGQMDNMVAQGRTEEIAPAIARIRAAGLPAGVAGHTPAVFAWAEQNLDVDFYMCAYYNPSSRARTAEHVAGAHEQFLDEDRDAMTKLIQGLSKPAIHYKIFAAGRNDPSAAFAYVARVLRPQDAVCIGVFTRDNPTMLEQDVVLLGQALAAAG